MYIIISLLIILIPAWVIKYINHRLTRPKEWSNCTYCERCQVEYSQIGILDTIDTCKYCGKKNSYKSFRYEGNKRFIK